MSIRFRFLIAFCLCGLRINCLLVYWRFMDPSGSIAGCGGLASCEQVLSSRGSQVFGIPVVAFGVLTYVVLSAALLWERRNVAAVCYMSMFGSSIWRGFVQGAILREICPWRMAAPSVGVTVVLLGLLETPWDQRFKLGLLAGVGAALAFAHHKVKASVLDPGLNDLWIDRLIKANITDWTALSRDTPKLPKLMISGKRILHGLPSGPTDFIQVMEKELNLPAAH
jgi:uncharacterized membrane protein